MPGITAGIGGLAAAGIPATHRDTNSAVAFVTGHASGGDVPDGIDWAALARAAPVLVIYMALKHLDAIAARLIAAGRAADEPVAIISKATDRGAARADDHALAAPPPTPRAAAIEPPAVVAIGPVVALAQKLNLLA